MSPCSPNASISHSPHVPFPCERHKVHCAKYSTSLDSRGYIPVYEFTFSEQPILWDRETGYVYWTGIWKAMGREKSEIAKLVDSNPELSREVKKIRGGFLKIQGTWLPFDQAYELARKTCWYIRDDLVPVFG
ncbi:DNA-binding domain of Mlu1-box binding protein MBP1, partial [Basidiobolus meristosporus CBS 931.73]